MLLITMSEWYGPSRYCEDDRLREKKPETRQRAFVTALPLGQALRRIAGYERAFKEKYGRGLVVEFELLSVATVDDISDEEADIARVRMVETLAQAATDF